jgi:hypothetical protein
MSDRATYARAAGYDDEHEAKLVAAITTAIAKASKVSDIDALVIRTGEAASALLSVLSFVLALSPSATRSPTAMRKTCEELHRRLRKRVASAETNQDLQDFVARVLHGGDVGGHA